MALVITSYLTVYDGMLFSQSSYKLNNTICGSVAFRIRSPNFSTYTTISDNRQQWAIIRVIDSNEQ